MLSFLSSRAFPGNVRELENAVQRMLFLKVEGSSLGLGDWLSQADQQSSGIDADHIGELAAVAWKAIAEAGVPCAQALREIEKRILEAALRAPGSTRRQLASRLHTSERTLYHKLRAHRLNVPCE